MTRYTLFMIFLIVLIGCSNDADEIKFNGNELIEYDKIKADFKAPEFKWGYLNKDGALAIADKYDDLREFNDGKAAFNQNGLWGYINKDGSIYLPARYRTVEEYSENRAIVRDLNYKYHLINEKGITILDSTYYEKINKFSNGRALIKDSQRYGYIDKNGNVAIELEYEYATDFIDSLAIVTKDRKQGIIDTDGNTIVPFEYDKIWPIKSGIIRYKNNKLYGYIDYKTKKKTHFIYL